MKIESQEERQTRQTNRLSRCEGGQGGTYVPSKWGVNDRCSACPVWPLLFFVIHPLKKKGFKSHLRRRTKEVIPTCLRLLWLLLCLIHTEKHRMTRLFLPSLDFNSFNHVVGGIGVHTVFIFSRAWVWVFTFFFFFFFFRRLSLIMCTYLHTLFGPLVRRETRICVCCPHSKNHAHEKAKKHRAEISPLVSILFV